MMRALYMLVLRYLVLRFHSKKGGGKKVPLVRQSFASMSQYDILKPLSHSGSLHAMRYRARPFFVLICIAENSRHNALVWQSPGVNASYCT